MNPLEFQHESKWLLADPELAVDFVGTQRRRGDALASELPDNHEATVWLREHIGPIDARRRDELMNLRQVLRDVFTAVVDEIEPPAESLEVLNELSAQAPVTLSARHTDEGFEVERTSPFGSADLLLADIARSALALLAESSRARLRLCRAPGCTLFFLTDRAHKRWCSPSCGNRARAARHYARHQQG
jgi:predicted RNA-binding Zn ribbon-like protein